MEFSMDQAFTLARTLAGTPATWAVLALGVAITAMFEPRRLTYKHWLGFYKGAAAVLLATAWVYLSGWPLTITLPELTFGQQGILLTAAGILVLMTMSAITIVQMRHLKDAVPASALLLAWIGIGLLIQIVLYMTFPPLEVPIFPDISSTVWQARWIGRASFVMGLSGFFLIAWNLKDSAEENDEDDKLGWWVFLGAALILMSVVCLGLISLFFGISTFLPG